MSDTNIQGAAPVATGSGLVLFGVVAAIVVAALAVIYHSGLGFMVSEWSQEEYSHGYLIPVIALFIVFQHRRELLAIEWQGAWVGPGLVVAAIITFVMGELSALYVIVQYSFLLALAGMALALVGWRGMRYLWVPLVYLIFMIPLPDFLYNNLSGKLQLISSQLGVAVIRLFNISVFLQGNVIDLGIYKLQVVEACSGLRYLFPLMSFGFLCAYLFRAPFWQRAVVFLSSIPLTVFMNSFRIGVIGVLVDRFGIEQAEGFLHDFEGWIIFMTCVAIMFLLMWIMTRMRADKPALRDAFYLDTGEPAEPNALQRRLTVLPAPYLAAVAVLLAGVVISLFLGVRPEIVPQRAEFVNFPEQLDDWRGTYAAVEEAPLASLKLKDYHSVNYVRPQAQTRDFINVWIAYYESQRKGASVHSPRSCIPGDGWEITSLSRRSIDVTYKTQQPLEVNRVLIEKGPARQLVYYWFDQRGRNITNEYLLKWYLLWDSLTRNRTDGSLVRVTVPLHDTDDLDDADQLLTDFIRRLNPELDSYLPD